LSDGGVFIFDINTQNKLDRHIANLPGCTSSGTIL
jgi:hypothetical protein